MTRAGEVAAARKILGGHRSSSESPHTGTADFNSGFSPLTAAVCCRSNLLPWPESPTDAQREAVEKSAQAVLDARAKFPDSTLADLYDPVTMPSVLVKAHADLDRAV